MLSACAINRTIRVKYLDSAIVPADFNPEKNVLLVVELRRRYKPSQKDEKRTKQMEDLFKKYYTYKFEIVSQEDLNLNNSKYADTSVYKYALLHKFNGVEHSSNTTLATGGGGSHTLSPSATTTYIAYCFLDRVSNKEFNLSYQSPWLKSAVEAFANTVKKVRKI